MLTEERIVEILTETRDAYQKAIEEIPMVEWNNYLIRRDLYYGICSYIRNKLLLIDFEQKIVVGYIDLNPREFVTAPPYKLNTYREALESLKFRRNYIDQKLKEKQTLNN